MDDDNSSTASEQDERYLLECRMLEGEFFEIYVVPLIVISLPLLKTVVLLIQQLIYKMAWTRRSWKSSFRSPRRTRCQRWTARFVSLMLSFWDLPLQGREVWFQSYLNHVKTSKKCAFQVDSLPYLRNSFLNLLYHFLLFLFRQFVLCHFICCQCFELLQAHVHCSRATSFVYHQTSLVYFKHVIEFIVVSTLEYDGCLILLISFARFFEVIYINKLLEGSCL